MATSLTLIVAADRHLCIGRDGGLPWHLPADLRRFKALTMGLPLLMGRRTWDSLPRRPLPGRLNLVMSRGSLSAPGARHVSSLDEALLACAVAGAGELAVIGGAEVYRLAMDRALAIEMTELDLETAAGDAFLPSLAGWDVASSTDWRQDEAGPRYRYRRLVRNLQLGYGCLPEGAAEATELLLDLSRRPHDAHASERPGLFTLIRFGMVSRQGVMTLHGRSEAMRLADIKSRNPRTHSGISPP